MAGDSDLQAMQALGAASGNFVLQLAGNHVPDGENGSNREPYISSFEIDGQDKPTGPLGSCETDTGFRLVKTTRSDQ